MKKIFYIIIALLVLAGIGTNIHAQETNIGTLPDSPFYFIKGWQEGIQVFLTYGAENKAKQFLQLANIRFLEYEKMFEKGKEKIAQKTLEKYQKQLNQSLDQVSQMEKQKKDTKDILQQIKNNATKSLIVLEQNIQKVSNDTKQSMQKVIDFLKQIIQPVGSNNGNNNGNNTGGQTSEQKCISAGGTIKVMSCCKSVADFPNSCGVGACGCSMENSKDTKFCDCGAAEKCFDGNQCISKGQTNDIPPSPKINCAIKKGAAMTYEEAKAIAIAACGYPIKEQHSCNSYTGTWWLDLDINKPGCNPACVVNVTNRTAEINWRCTGLLQ